MQWFFNLLYRICDFFFDLLGNISAPAWVSDFATNVTRFCVITNYYFPLGTLVTVVLAVIGVTLVLMVISAILQLL